MNLLFLAHRIPYPPDKGDKIRSWNELRYLAARHRVHLGCLADQAEDMRHVPRLAAITASLEVAPLDARAARLRSLAGLAASTPFSVRWFASAQLRRWVEATLAREAIDAVFLFSSPMAAYARHTQIPFVMDFCDVDSDKWRQYARRAPWPLRPLYALEARRLRAYEESVLRRAAAATLVAQREKDLWADLDAELLAKVHVVPNGVDLEYFAPDQPAPGTAPEPNTIVFTGAMDYYANVDAVRYFAADVLPRIQAELPDVRFVVVGSRPAPEVRALARRPGIVVTGFVEDTRVYYRRAALCVVPLRIARGIQNKVLEAMAMGRPVLATTAAAAGLGASAGDEIRVADTAAALAREAVALLRDPARAARLGRAARRFVARHYVWERSLGELEKLIEASATRRRVAEHRVGPAPAPAVLVQRT
jgi:sugar transferase (PEP-CTERM/EpsH1 system associated)